MKKCKYCGKELNEGNAKPDKSVKCGYRNVCKSCYATYMRNWRLTSNRQSSFKVDLNDLSKLETVNRETLKAVYGAIKKILGKK